jgi:hypothetical protein
VDTFSVETNSVELTASVFVVMVEPTDVEKLLYCENTVKTFSVETNSVELTV